MQRCHLAFAMFFAAGAAETYGEQSAPTHLGFLTCSLAAWSNAPDANASGPLRQTRENAMRIQAR